MRKSRFTDAQIIRCPAGDCVAIGERGRIGVMLERKGMIMNDKKL